MLPLGDTLERSRVDSKGALSFSTIGALRGGGWSGPLWLPAGWNPWGYKITKLGEDFLRYDGSLDCDVGRFLASLKTKRKTTKALKDAWLEVVRAGKKAQAMRIYRQLDDLIAFCLQAGLID
jgi:hypothetical protein